MAETGGMPGGVRDPESDAKAPELLPTWGRAARAMRVSIVLPAYNEEERLRTTLPRLVRALRDLPDAEVIVVDDGSDDATWEVACSLLGSVPRARVVRLPRNLGKGAAVRYGVSVADGDSIVFMDADLASDVNYLPALVRGLEEHDIVVGSRRLQGSVVEGRSEIRGLMNKLFAGQVRALTGVRAGDPQCGFKAFRAPVAKLLFSVSKLDGFAFDVEILMLSQRLGYSVREIPVRWEAVAGSKVRLVRDSVRMFRDVFSIRMRGFRSSERDPRLCPWVGHSDNEAGLVAVGALADSATP
jgi:glycosyltransferase involved in cell wall biosynthesis